MPPHQICGHPVQTYRIPIAGKELTLLGPAEPDKLLDDPRTEARYHAEDEYLPYWATPWASAVMLAEFVCARGDGAGRRALEIGCGLGLTGLAAARNGWRVTLTDYDSEALAFARESAKCNAIANVEFCRANWREPASVEGDFDLLLAADVLFEARWVEPIAEFLALRLGLAIEQEPCGAGGLKSPCGLVCDPCRRTSEGFAEALARRGLSVRTHPMQTTQPDAVLTKGMVYEVWRA